MDISFPSEDYEIIYFIGVYPLNRNDCFKKACKMSNKVVIFENPDLIKRISLNLPQNVLVISYDYESQTLMDIIQYYLEDIQGGFKLNKYLDPDPDLDLVPGIHSDLDSDIYFKVSEIILREKIFRATPEDLLVISSLHNDLYEFNTKYKNINYNLIKRLFSKTIERRIKIGETEDIESCNMFEKIIKEDLSIFIFNGGKQNYSFIKDSSKGFLKNYENINETFNDRAYDIFLGIVIETNNLTCVTQLSNLLAKKCESLNIPKRFLIFYDCHLPINNNKLVCYIYVKDEKNYAKDYLIEINQSSCLKNDGIFCLPKKSFKDWLLYK